MRTILSAAICLCLTAAEIWAAAQSRLETDFAEQQAALTCFEGETDEGACGGTWLQVYLAGTEIRKLQWDVVTSMRVVRREFYYSRGKAALVIETSWFRYDDSGELLEEPTLQYVRRYWLRDGTAGPSGVQVRRELRAHALFLEAEFREHKDRFTKTN